MTIRYLQPLSDGWNHMINMLFRPFDIGKWFVVGFTAFLANLLEGPSGSASNKWKGGVRIDIDEISTFPEIIREWIVEHPHLVAMIGSAVLFVILLLILLAWLSSRGKFMFLDNVIHNRALIAKSWYEYSEQGNSLFIWRICFGIASVAAIVAWVAMLLYFIFQLHAENISPDSGLIIFFIMLLFALIAAILYIALFLNDFIVPIMYRNKISATEAWRIFLDTFSAHWFSFIAYGILKFILNILVVITVMVLGFFTCCLGFILLIIPYISSVVLLPVSVTFRSFSVKFLEQFSEEFRLFPLENESLISQ